MQVPSDAGRPLDERQGLVKEDFRLSKKKKVVSKSGRHVDEAEKASCGRLFV